MELRQAHHDDVPALEALISLSARELSVPYYTAAQIEAAVMHVFGVDTRLIEDGTYYLVEHAGRIVGCGGWSRRAALLGGDRFSDRSDAPLDPMIEPARIRAFFVHPEFGRRGIGRSLILACEAAARAAGFARIELVATLPGEPLYAAFGYEVIEPVDIPTPGGITVPAKRMGKGIRQRSEG